jgi:tetratricopeptide (TPR) repeat protein
MRVVKADDVPSTFDGARQLEQRGELKKAIELYEDLLKRSADDLKIITRLIILYRKLKNYKKEVSLINKAIKIHEQRYTPKKVNKEISLISKKLNRLLGHTDKKGKNMVLPGEIIKLQNRKALLQKKIS